MGPQFVHTVRISEDDAEIVLDALLDRAKAAENRADLREAEQIKVLRRSLLGQLLDGEPVQVEGRVA